MLLYFVISSFHLHAISISNTVTALIFIINILFLFYWNILLVNIDHRNRLMLTIRWKLVILLSEYDTVNQNES